MIIMSQWSHTVEHPESNIVCIRNTLKEAKKAKNKEELEAKSMLDKCGLNCFNLVKNKNKHWKFLFKSEINKRKIL